MLRAACPAGRTTSPPPPTLHQVVSFACLCFICFPCGAAGLPCPLHHLYAGAGVWGLGVSRGRRLLAVRKAGKRRHWSSSSCSPLGRRCRLIALPLSAQCGRFFQGVQVDSMFTCEKVGRKVYVAAGRQKQSRGATGQQENEEKQEASKQCSCHTSPALARYLGHSPPADVVAQWAGAPPTRKGKHVSRRHERGNSCQYPCCCNQM